MDFDERKIAESLFEKKIHMSEQSTSRRPLPYFGTPSEDDRNAVGNR
jgi:hypothetical protein